MAEVYRAADLEVRPDEHLVLAHGRVLSFSVRELQVLVALIRRENRIVTREQLYDAVWGGQMREADRAVDVYVHKVRAKLQRALPGCRFIHTPFGIGYRFAPDPGSFTAFSHLGPSSVARSPQAS